MPNIYVKGHFVRKLSSGHTETRTVDRLLYTAAKASIIMSRVHAGKQLQFTATHAMCEQISDHLLLHYVS